MRPANARRAGRFGSAARPGIAPPTGPLVPPAGRKSDAARSRGHDSAIPKQRTDPCATGAADFRPGHPPFIPVEPAPPGHVCTLIPSIALRPLCGKSFRGCSSARVCYFLHTFACLDRRPFRRPRLCRAVVGPAGRSGRVGLRARRGEGVEKVKKSRGQLRRNPTSCGKGHILGHLAGFQAMTDGSGHGWTRGDAGGGASAQRGVDHVRPAELAGSGRLRRVARDRDSRPRSSGPAGAGPG